MMFHIIRPHIFHDLSHIDCLFTEANRNSVSFKEKKKTIPGLNFGLTSEAPLEEVRENYNTFLNSIDLGSKELAIARQVHGNRIEVVEKAGVYDQTDGLITRNRDLLLGIQVADCAAVLAADSNPDNGIIGAFHAGWRGALKGIVPEGITKMVQLGGEMKSLKVYISPCISVEHFEVGNEVASEFPAEYCKPGTNEKSHIDLKNYIRDQLINSGIEKQNIESSAYCTIRDEQFYSYRRERSRSGRMLGLISLA